MQVFTAVADQVMIFLYVSAQWNAETFRRSRKKKTYCLHLNEFSHLETGGRAFFRNFETLEHYAAQKPKIE